jgi:hypothetical protein
MTTDGTPSPTRRLVRVLTRVWHWLLARWRTPAPAPAPPPPPAPGRLRERRGLQAPLVVPAHGYVHHFKVHAAFVWHSDGLPREVLAAHVQHFMPHATRELKAIAASCAREHFPHHAQELEVKLQQVLEERGERRYRRGSDEVTLRPSAWVELDDRVKRAVEPYWEQLIKLDCEHTVQVKRAEYAEQLSHRWLEVLTDLVGSRLADSAAHMTASELAAVVEKIAAERRTAESKLESLLEQRIRDGDAFEQMEHFAALKEHLEHVASMTFVGKRSADSPMAEHHGM